MTTDLIHAGGCLQAAIPLPAKPSRAARPTSDQPGTLGEELRIIAITATNPTRLLDFEGAREQARQRVLEHARGDA